MNGLGRKKEDKGNLNQSIFTKETFGVVLVLFATLCLVCLITRGLVFSAPGVYVNAFLFGTFGVFAFAVIAFVIAIGVLMVVGKKFKMSLKRKVLFTVTFSLIALLAHVITLHGQNLNYGEYLAKSYLMAGESGFTSASGGGLITAIIAYPLVALLTEVGVYVVLSIAILSVGYFLVKDYLNGGVVKSSGSSRFRSSFVKKQKTQIDVEIEGERDYPVDGVVPVKENKQQLFVNNPEDFAVKSRREMARDNQTAGIKITFSEGGLGVVSSTTESTPVKINDEYKKKLEYIKTPAALDVEKLANNSRPSYSFEQRQEQTSVQPPISDVDKPTVEQSQSYTSVSDYVNPRETSVENIAETDDNIESEIPFIDHSESLIADGDDATTHAENFERLYAETPEPEENTNFVAEPDEIFTPVEQTDSEVEEQAEVSDIPFIEEEQEQVDFAEQAETNEFEQPAPTNIRNERMRNLFLSDKEEKQEDKVEFTSRATADGNLGARRSGFSFESVEQTPPQLEEQEKPKKPAPPINREYFRPPFDLLETYTAPVDAPKENHQERMEIIQRTLEEFHINAVPQSYIQGPAITRYEIKMPAGVSVKKVLNYDDDLKMWLSAKDGVRIEAPIPGKSLVGIEVANNVKTTVGLREVMEAAAGQKGKDGSLMFVLGKNLVGEAIVENLAKGPHYLVAGATGSGKSVCLNVMIVSLIMRYTPEELRLILVDPKSVEFMNYEHIPHLMIDEIITEPKRALAVLSWAYAEMERRYAMFRTEGGGLVVDIDSYNSVVASDTVPKLPRIVIIIDELADLMETCKKDLESRIRALAQKARSAGIHLVLATQRPSVDIITGTIKANLPSRIAFKVMNFADSQTILGEAGAEKLLGNGDMLCKTAQMSSVERYQGAYISSREVNNVVSYIKEHNKAYFDDELAEYLDKETKPKQEETAPEGDNEGGENEFGELFLKALWLAVNSETVSISLLQRRFQIGYSRAGGLVDKMERMGFVSGNEGSKARRVLLSREEFENRFGAMPD